VSVLRCEWTICTTPAAANSEPAATAARPATELLIEVMRCICDSFRWVDDLCAMLATRCGRVVGHAVRRHRPVVATRLRLSDDHLAPKG
jgi:hypothetical protein